MKQLAKALLATVALAILSGCAATIPVKVATKTTKAGLKTAKTGAKVVTKTGAALIPDGEKEAAK